MRGLDRFKRTFIGDRAFYRVVFAIVVPIIIQNSVSNFVNLLDNIMVGQVGTAQLSGVAVANQLLFVFNLCVFGGLAGPGIFGAQYYGAGDMEGLRNTFRIKLWIAASILLISLAIFIGWGDRLILNYLTGEGEAAAAEAILESGRAYLGIMLIGLFPFALTQSYSGTLREAGETMLPMKAGIAAVLTNLCGNWILIYGNLGFPAMGVEGAAIATVLSRFVELAIIVVGTHRSPRYSFMRGVYRTLKIPAKLLRSVMKKGMPLLVNEAFWSMGMAMLMQIYSVRGLMVLAGLNIASTINNLFNVVFLSMGNAVAVMIGQSLGANDMQRARTDVWKLMSFSFFSCVVIGSVLAILSPVFPLIYNTDEGVRFLAARFILTAACIMPVNSIAHACYFTLRSGGSTIITFLFDSVYTWAVNIPFALLLVYGTGLDIMMLYPICQLVEIVKSAIGLILVKKGVWIRNIVSGHETSAEIAGQEG
jgi:putative MATE family efflux protein